MYTHNTQGHGYIWWVVDVNFDRYFRFEQIKRPYYEFNTSKLKSLGFKFKSIQDMFDDCIASLVKQGHLPSI